MRDSTRICIVRHGETDWNAQSRIQGHLDIPLNATGRAQAQAMAASAGRHGFAAIYSSDLCRAMETAQALSERTGVEVRPLPQLRERHFGIFQGLTATEGAALHPAVFARYSARDPHCDFETGETMLDLVERITQGIVWMARHHPNQTLCAVAHGGVLDILYRKATGRPLETPRDFTIPNCGLNWFRFDAAGWHLERWGDREHLEQVLIETPE